MKKQPSYMFTASTECYAADEVDARIAELEKALREAMEWDWLTDSPPPKEIVDQCNKALGL